MMAEPLRNPADTGLTDVVPSTNQRRTKWAWLFATFLGVGYLGRGRATYAAAIVVVLWGWLAPGMVTAPGLAILLPLIAIATAGGILAGNHVTRESGLKDPQVIVIDEVAGQLIAFIAAPLGWKYLLASFILFRVFDISKPFPLRRLERLHGGLGVMMDDVGAGLYALLALQLLMYFNVL